MTHQDVLRQKHEITTSPSLGNEVRTPVAVSLHMHHQCAGHVCTLQCHHGDVHPHCSVTTAGLSPRIPAGTNTDGATQHFRCFNIFINFFTRLSTSSRIVSYEKGVEDYPLRLTVLGNAPKHCTSKLPHPNFIAQDATPSTTAGTSILGTTWKAVKVLTEGPQEKNQDLERELCETGSPEGSSKAHH